MFNSFPVLLITGPRQVGKTTVLKMCQQEGRNYVALDDLDVRSIAQNDPGLFLQTYKAPLIIDLLGLSQAELLNYNNKPFLPSADWLEHAYISKASTQNLTQVYKQIWYGSFPKINLERKEQIKNRFYMFLRNNLFAKRCKRHFKN